MAPPQNCYCQINTSELGCENFDYEEIFATIPDIFDVTLYGNDSQEGIRASKIILASLGPIFDSLLDKSEVMLDYPLAIVHAIQEFALTGQLRCDDTNSAVLLLRAAKKFDLRDMKNIAGNYLLSQMTNENILNIYELCQELLCHHSVAWVQKVILAKFLALAQNPTFLQSCKATWWEQFLLDDELNSPEEELFTILETWAKISPANSDAFLHLIKFIRFQLMKPDFFNQIVKTCELLQGNPLIKKVEKFGQHHNNKVHRFLFKPNYRLPNELVFAVGGFGSKALSDMEVFDIRAKKWTKVKQFFPPHAYHGLVADDLNLHVLGGYGDEGFGPTFCSSIYSFNLVERKWFKHSTFLTTSRCYNSVAELDDEVYCIGGYNGQSRLQSVEKFDKHKQSWTPVAPMQAVRSDACAVTYGNKIIVVGGFTGDEIHDSIEIYNSSTNEWNYGPRLNIPRSGLKAVVLEDKLYALGGFNGFDRLTSVETLDLLTPNSAWMLSSNLNIKRSNFGITVFEKSILVAGGFDGVGVTNTCEIFDLKNKRWGLGPKMNVKRSALSLVTVPNLPNRKEYLSYRKKT